MLSDAHFQEEIRNLYGATMINHSPTHFTIVTSKDLPLSLAQLAYQINIDAPLEIKILGQNYPVDYVSDRRRVTYVFASAAYESFQLLLTKEIEDKRYADFSKVFDVEVQSELDHKKD